MCASRCFDVEVCVLEVDVLVECDLDERLQLRVGEHLIPRQVAQGKRVDRLLTSFDDAFRDAFLRQFIFLMYVAAAHSGGDYRHYCCHYKSILHNVLINNYIGQSGLASLCLPCLST